MENIEKLLRSLFAELNARIEALNLERESDGLFAFPKAKVQLLGQFSLLVNKKISTVLSLAHTGDLDALLKMDHSIKIELKKLLAKNGFVYDEDSPLIWIPEGSKFEEIYDFDHIKIESIDSESALVSKAIKARHKNLQLIREAIASDAFPTLVDRILKHGGRLEDFL